MSKLSDGGPPHLLGTCADRRRVLRRVPHRRCEQCGHMPDTVTICKRITVYQKPSHRLPGDHDQRPPHRAKAGEATKYEAEQRMSGQRNLMKTNSHR
jgi:hypothetical protein